MKKALSLLLFFVLLLGVISYSVFAAEPAYVAHIDGVKYTDLQAAVDAAEAGDTVVLMRDIVYTNEANYHVFIDKSLTLYLGAYTITSTTDGRSFDYEPNPYVNDLPGVLFVRAPSVGASKIDVAIQATTGGIVATGDKCAISGGNIVDDYAKTDLTVNGGNYASAGNICINWCNGLATIDSGSYRSADSEAVLDNTDLCMGYFMVNGGKFYGFNPACMSINHGEHHNHVSIVPCSTGVLGEDGWYTVEHGIRVAATLCTCTAYTYYHTHCFSTLQDAIDAALKYDKTVVILAKIEITAEVKAAAEAQGITFKYAYELDPTDYRQGSKLYLAELLDLPTEEDYKNCPYNCNPEAPEAPVEYYTVTWNNYDGSTIMEQEVWISETPVYPGETPVRAEDARYTYEFIGWSPEISPVTGSITYTADFKEIEKPASPIFPFLVTGVTQVKTIDAETEAALEGATFELYRISSTGSRKLQGKYTSNATGRITARTLSSRFTYELVMTEAPEGYDLLETPIIFRVQYNRPLQQVVPVTKTVVETPEA